MLSHINGIAHRPLVKCSLVQNLYLVLVVSLLKLCLRKIFIFKLLVVNNSSFFKLIKLIIITNNVSLLSNVFLFEAWRLCFSLLLFAIGCSFRKVTFWNWIYFLFLTICPEFIKSLLSGNGILVILDFVEYLAVNWILSHFEVFVTSLWGEGFGS